MNSVATAAGAVAAFLGANFMLVPRFIVGAGDRGASVIMFLTAIPVAIALLLSWRFAPRVLGPDDTKRAIHGSAVYAVITGWLHGARTVVQLPDGCCHLVRLGRAPDGGRHQLAADLVAGPSHERPGGRWVGYRAGVLRRVRTWSLPGDGV